MFNKIIDDIGKELNIKVIHLSDNWLTVLEKNNQIHYIQGYKFDLNNHAIGNIIDDKGLFYDLCKEKNIPIIEHFVIFKNYLKSDVLTYFKNNNRNIVVKGNIGTCGKEVFHVNNEKELFEVIEELFLKEYSLSLCPYYDIQNEYRVIVLNHEARLVYGKIRPMVIGDGKSTINKLIKDNQIYYENKNNIDLTYIPKKNEEIQLNFQFNLSRGAKMFLNIDDKLKKQLIEMALTVTNKLNIIFASIDIIYTTDNKLMVMETNSGVMMSNYIKINKEKGYQDAYNLYKDAIKLMFENDNK